MSQVKLTYFDFSGSRGEECRLALFLAGVDFEDNRLAPGTWPDIKATTPFGSLPILEIEGKGQLGETNAILTFIGKQHGLHPKDPWEAAKHEALLSACEHIRVRVSSTSSLSDEAKKTAREALVKGPIPLFGESIEGQLGEGPFVAGDSINVIDLKLFMVVRGLTLGSFDHIPTNLLSVYPKLMSVCEAVEKHPKVAEWMSR